ncbi:MAG: ATP-grasp domain-containing protein [Chloroflexi bacterium]|nr:ATP-grasp domain-containing protein [Chloroflexota bacterium]
MTSSNPKVLIANRGEIACRVARACRTLGYGSVAVYSDADATALHVRLADEARHIGGARPQDSYLLAERIIQAAIDARADAVHPGYGFLAEDPAFAEAVVSAGLVFIGPSSSVIAAMGEKAAARKLAHDAGVPILPGSGSLHVDDESSLEAIALDIGYPLLVKASAGGGGIGMRLVTDPAGLHAAIAQTKSQASAFFGDGSVYLERAMTDARHVEVQVFGIPGAGVVHVFERDCSVQRRNQKIIEETPAPQLDASIRRELFDSAVRLAERVDYQGAGTVEFLVDASGRIAFLEMNTRIQVEHPVTELVTGIDLVGWQLRAALGDEAGVRREASGIRGDGAAIEVRIVAEDPSRGFIPSPGQLKRFRPPVLDDHLRLDLGYTEGDTITPYYDPLLGKLIARGADRDQARERLLAALGDFEVEGIRTNIRYLSAVLDDAVFRDQVPTTTYLTDNHPRLSERASSDAARTTAMHEPIGDGR